MKLSNQLAMMVNALVVVGVLSLPGCTDKATTEATPVSEEHADHSHDEHGDHDHGDGEHGEAEHAMSEHGAWWCGEHGVPEEVCAQCDKSLVAEFKEKGDWCEEHNRPDSQCFKCHPENFEKFASLYEAKFGERPEMPTE